MEWLWVIFWGIVAGVVIGPLARLVIPGRQNISLAMTIGIGAVGAIGGGFLYEAFGGEGTSGIDWIRLAVQVGVAVVLVLLYAGTQRDRTAA